MGCILQDKKIAHTPYHALSPEEKDIFNARKHLLERLGELTREAVKAKEREWAKDGILRKYIILCQPISSIQK